MTAQVDDLVRACFHLLRILVKYRWSCGFNRSGEDTGREVARLTPPWRTRSETSLQGLGPDCRPYSAGKRLRIHRGVFQHPVSQGTFSQEICPLRWTTSWQRSKLYRRSYRNKTVVLHHVEPAVDTYPYHARQSTRSASYGVDGLGHETIRCVSGSYSTTPRSDILGR